jgi:hypothetical protein
VSAATATLSAMQTQPRIFINYYTGTDIHAVFEMAFASGWPCADLADYSAEK